jgi:hypothetical protein
MRLRAPPSNAGLWRFEAGDQITMLAAAAEPATRAKWAVGTRTPVDGDTLAAMVYRTGRPARLDTYGNVSGTIAAQVREVGVRSPEGVPVIVDGDVWGLAAVGSAHAGRMAADTEARMGAFAELIATAIVAGYRDEQKRQLLGEESRRPLLMDSVPHGRLFDRWWSPPRCPPSARWLCPKLNPSCAAWTFNRRGGCCPICRSGIVHIKSEQRLDTILALLSRATTNRVGVSARFDDLSDTRQAFHVAKVTLRGGARDADRVAVFDGSILATAAVSAPAVMVKAVRTVLDGFSDLGEEERTSLRNVSGLAGQRRIRARNRLSTQLPPQHRALSAAANRATHGPIVV